MRDASRICFISSIMTPSSVFRPSSSLCWRQNLCRSPNRHSVRGQKFLNLRSKNMEQSAVCTQTARLKFCRV